MLSDGADTTRLATYEPATSADGVPQVAEAATTGWHEIRVAMRRPLLRAIVRPGYYR